MMSLPLQAASSVISVPSSAPVTTHWYESVLTYLLNYAPFLFMLTFMALLMYFAHSSTKEKFNVYDTLLDNGQSSLEKIGVWVGIFSISWWFFEKVAERTATWQDALAYGGILGVSKFAAAWLNGKFPAKDSTQ